MPTFAELAAARAAVLQERKNKVAAARAAVPPLPPTAPTNPHPYWAAGVRGLGALLSGEGGWLGAGFSGAGETAAQFLEGARNYDDLDKTRIATEAGIGAIPFGRFIKGGKVLSSAVKGGALGAVAPILRHDTAEMQKPSDLITNIPRIIAEHPGEIATGAAISGATSGVLAKFLGRTAVNPHVIESEILHEPSTGTAITKKGVTKTSLFKKAKGTAPEPDNRIALFDDIGKRQQGPIHGPDPEPLAMRTSEEVAADLANLPPSDPNAAFAQEPNVQPGSDSGRMQRIAAKAAKNKTAKKQFNTALAELGDYEKQTSLSQTFATEDGKNVTVKYVAKGEEGGDTPLKKLLTPKPKGVQAAEAVADPAPPPAAVTPPDPIPAPPAEGAAIPAGSREGGIPPTGPRATGHQPYVDQPDSPAILAKMAENKAKMKPEHYAAYAEAGEKYRVLKGFLAGAKLEGHTPEMMADLRFANREAGAALTNAERIGLGLEPHPTITRPVTKVRPSLTKAPAKVAPIDPFREADLAAGAQNMGRSRLAELKAEFATATTPKAKHEIAKEIAAYEAQAAAVADEATPLAVNEAGKADYSKLNLKDLRNRIATFGKSTDPTEQKIAADLEAELANRKGASQLKAAPPKDSNTNTVANMVDQPKPRLNKKGGTTLGSGFGALQGSLGLAKEHPEFTKRLVTGAAGAAIGGYTDPLDNPLLSAAAGGAAGAALGPALLQNPAAVGEVTGLKKLFKEVPQVQRANMLLSTRIPANAIAAPVGHTFFEGLERMIGGDPKGRQILAHLAELTPNSYMKELGQSGELMGRIENMSPDATTFGGRLLEAPGRLINAGDALARKVLGHAGLNDAEARMATATNEPMSKFGTSVRNFGRKSVLGQILMPFPRTFTNLFEQGSLRTPIVRQVMQALEAAPEIPMSARMALTQQGLGLATGLGSEQLSENLTPDQARFVRPYVSNLAGLYSMPANIGFAVGQARRPDHPGFLEAAQELNQSMPVPSGFDFTRTGLARRLTPNAMADLAEWVDPAQSRKASTFLDQLKARIPGLRESLPQGKPKPTRGRATQRSARPKRSQG